MAWLTGYGYRKTITVSNAVANYPIKIKVGKTSDAVGEDVDCNGHVDDTFKDIRFTAADQSTLLDYWLESVVASGGTYLATIWVQNNATPDTTLYMYYSNAGASDAGNGYNTFSFFDDFNDASLDTTTNWVVTNANGAYSEASGVLTVTAGAATPASECISSKTATFGTAYVLRVRCKTATIGYVPFVGFNKVRGTVVADELTTAMRVYSADANYKNVSGNDTDYEVVDSGVAKSTSAYKIHEVRRLSGVDDAWFIDDAAAGTGQYDTIQARYIDINALGASDQIIVDWIMVRPYVATEPSFAYGAESGELQTISNIGNLSTSSTFYVASLLYDQTIEQADVIALSSTFYSPIMVKLLKLSLLSTTGTFYEPMVILYHTIDMGSAAEDRTSYVWLQQPLYGYQWTFIDTNNPANLTGTIDTVEIYLVSGYTAEVFAGTWHGTAPIFSNRDYESIGSIVGGSKQTVSGLDIDVVAGDVIGVFGTETVSLVGAAIEYEVGAFSGDVYLKLGNQFGNSNITFTKYAIASKHDAISIYATGLTPAPLQTIANIGNLSTTSTFYQALLSFPSLQTITVASRISTSSTFYSLTLLRLLLHAIISAHLYKPGAGLLPKINHVYVIGRDKDNENIFVQGEASDDSDIPTGEIAVMLVDGAIPSRTDAESVADAVLAAGRLIPHGNIGIRPNLGHDLWDVITITDSECNASAQKYRVIGRTLHFDKYADKGRGKFEMNLTVSEV